MQRGFNERALIGKLRACIVPVLTLPASSWKTQFEAAIYLRSVPVPDGFDAYQEAVLTFAETLHAAAEHNRQKVTRGPVSRLEDYRQRLSTLFQVA